MKTSSYLSLVFFPLFLPIQAHFLSLSCKLSFFLSFFLSLFLSLPVKYFTLLGSCFILSISRQQKPFLSFLFPLLCFLSLYSLFSISQSNPTSTLHFVLMLIPYISFRFHLISNDEIVRESVQTLFLSLRRLVYSVLYPVIPNVLKYTKTGQRPKKLDCFVRAENFLSVFYCSSFSRLFNLPSQHCLQLLPITISLYGFDHLRLSTYFSVSSNYCPFVRM